MFPISQEKNRKKTGNVLLPWLQKFYISKLFLGRNGHCIVKRWKERIGYKCKKRREIEQTRTLLYFTFTQKWSSTKYMLIFCNKWKLLHEKRVQSRQYFFGYINMAGELFCCCCFCFCFVLHVTPVVVNSRDIQGSFHT